MPDFPESNPPAAQRLIVVDDDTPVREMLVRVLTEAGYQAFPADSGRQALEVLAAHQIDLALVDLAMPGENGWSALAAMRQRHPALRAIIITAWPHQQAAARAAGASACFEKPLDFPELLAAIARALPANADHSVDHHGARHVSRAPAPPPFS